MAEHLTTQVQFETTSSDRWDTTKKKLSCESPKNLLDYLFMIIKSFEEKNYWVSLKSINFKVVYMKYPIHDYDLLY